MSRLRGVLAAALTPLRDGGEALDLDAVGPYCDFLLDGGVDGIFALGTTGECVLLAVDERKMLAEAFCAAIAGRGWLAVHAGALSTRDTVSLAEHAAGIGADAVAVIAPPYYPFTDDALLEHFAAAAAACAPVAFYAYEFAARSGYAIPVDVLRRLRERAPNFVGLKTSDKPFSEVEPYMLDGVDVFVGFEPMLPEALAAGAVGTVSGLAAVYPADVVAAVVDPTQENAQRLVDLRAVVEPILPRGKNELAQRGLLRRDCRAPMLPM